MIKFFRWLSRKYRSKRESNSLYTIPITHIYYQPYNTLSRNLHHLTSFRPKMYMPVHFRSKSILSIYYFKTFHLTYTRFRARSVHAEQALHEPIVQYIALLIFNLYFCALLLLMSLHNNICIRLIHCQLYLFMYFAPPYQKTDSKYTTTTTPALAFHRSTYLPDFLSIHHGPAIS